MGFLGKALHAGRTYPASLRTGAQTPLLRHCEPVPQHWCGNLGRGETYQPVQEDSHESSALPRNDEKVSLRTGAQTPLPRHCEPVPQHWCGNLRPFNRILIQPNITTKL